MNINQALAEVAYKYSVPISLEAATDEDFLKSRRVTVQVTRGKIADVLNSIVEQKPADTWEVTETSIRVFPRSDFRDPLLQTLLELRIGRFVLPKRSAKLTFRQTLSGRPELKNLLASYGVSSSIEAFSPHDIAPFEMISRWMLRMRQFDYYWIAPSRIVQPSIGLLIETGRTDNI